MRILLRKFSSFFYGGRGIKSCLLITTVTIKFSHLCKLMESLEFLSCLPTPFSQNVHTTKKSSKLLRARSRPQRPSGRFLLRRRLLCGPDKWRINSWSDSNVSWQKQQLKWPVSPLSPPPPPTEMTFL